VGSKLVVAEDGEFAGSVSGGCVENAVITAALACIADGKPRVLEYAGDAKFPWEVGLPCGGTIRVYVETFAPIFEQALAALEAGNIVAIVTDLTNGEHTLVTGQEPDANLPLEVRGALRLPASAWRSLMIAAPEGDSFIDIYRPPLRLVIVGATHLAQSLAAMAALYGYDVTIVDPRAAYLTASRFATPRLVLDGPGQALEALRLDAETAIVTVSHDPKIDDPALVAALRSEAFYIGALGSRKSHAARCERLRAAGFDEAMLARIHGPVGLDIGAISPPEIAGAILAQMTQILRGKA
jgi:xanthine dehydrogenase accessory factor